MLSIKQVLCEIEACSSNLKICLLEERFIDMPYVLGKLMGYSELLQEMINTKLCDSE